MYKFKVLMFTTALFFVNVNAYAELIFSAPPRGSEAEERATYEPLAQSMSAVIGEQVRYAYPRGFLDYSVNMQKGNYDIVFDGPHFAQWRVTNLHHTILVNLPENLQFLVVAPKTQTNFNSLHDLIYATVCAQMTPQLGTLMLLRNYYERAVEPQLRLVRGEERVLSDFTAGECAAAVLRDKRFYKMSDAERANYKIIYTSTVAPNDAITVNQKITPEQRKALIALLTDPAAMKVAARIFDRFSRNAVVFHQVDASQYTGLDQLLLLAFGWDTNKIDINKTANAAGK